MAVIDNGNIFDQRVNQISVRILRRWKIKVLRTCNQSLRELWDSQGSVSELDSDPFHLHTESSGGARVRELHEVERACGKIYRRMKTKTERFSTASTA